MQVAVEVSMYPFTPDYEPPIKDFIRRLNENAPDIKIITNTLSTQLYGAYDEIMPLLQAEMKRTFEQENKVVMVMKVLNADLKDKA